MSVDLDGIVGRMALREKVGQVVMGINAPSWEIAPDVERLIREHHVGSVISCGYRTFDPWEAAAYNNRLQEIALETGARIPLLNGGDFEQGIASQIPMGTTAFPQQMGIAATWNEGAAERAAEITGREGRALGFHWTFAPDCDVNNNPANPVIGIRTFSDDTELVSRLTVAQLRGYGRAGFLATPKHFPGHGDTAVDSHRGLPVLSCPEEELRAVHLPPFVAAIAAGCPTIMTAHVVVSALDSELPATLSPRILTGLLRDELGFEGVVITDQMTMRSVADRWGVERGSVLAFLAGSDVVLGGGDTALQEATVEAMVAAVESGEITQDRLDASVRRVLCLKEQCGLFENPMVDLGKNELVGNAADGAEAARMAESSIVVVRNESVLPFARTEVARTLVAGVTNESVFGPTRASHVGEIADLVREVAGGEVTSWSACGEDPAPEDVVQAVEHGKAADRIIVLTYARGALPGGQAMLVERLAALGKPLVAVAMGTPYDLLAYPDVSAYIAGFVQSFVPIHLSAHNVARALIEVIFGLSPRGRLPVTIPGYYERGQGLRYT